MTLNDLEKRGARGPFCRQISVRIYTRNVWPITTKFGMTTYVRNGRLSIGQPRSIIRGGPERPLPSKKRKIGDLLYMRAHGKRSSNQILHADQTKYWSFLQGCPRDHAPSQSSVTRMLTRAICCGSWPCNNSVFLCVITYCPRCIRITRNSWNVLISVLNI